MKALGKEPEWVEIELGVDSGASETVVGPEMLSNVELSRGEQYQKGVQYEIADGTLIPNLGEKAFIGVSENNVVRGLTAQVADVNQGLLSVRKMMRSGYRVTFDEDGSTIVDKETGEIMNMRDDGSMFLLKLWCKQQNEEGC